jgi:hypothetical protein
VSGGFVDVCPRAIDAWPTEPGARHLSADKCATESARRCSAFGWRKARPRRREPNRVDDHAPRMPDMVSADQGRLEYRSRARHCGSYGRLQFGVDPRALRSVSAPAGDSLEHPRELDSGQTLPY